MRTQRHISLPVTAFELSRKVVLLACIVLATWHAGTSPSIAGTPRSARYDGSGGMRYPFEARYNRNVSMTAEAWVYRENATRCEAIISHNFSDSFWLGFCPKLRFYRSGGTFADADIDVPARQWTHVAASYDGTTVRFYIDGQPAGTKSLSHSGATASGHVYVGTDSRPIFSFQGSLDEVRLWSTARSESQIRDHMEVELRGEAGLEAVWDDGGLREVVNLITGAATSVLPVQQVFGILPRSLVVPLAAITPSINGSVDLSREYAGAEQIVLRYRDGAGFVVDAVAYLVRTTSHLYIGVKGARLPAEGNPLGNSAINLYLDTNGDGLRPLSSSDLNATLYLDDRGLGFRRGAGFRWGADETVPFSTFSGVVSTAGGSEFSATDMEFFCNLSLLGSWSDTDRFAIAHTSNGGPHGSITAPDSAVNLFPGTWVEMRYSDETIDLPTVSLSGTVTHPETRAPVDGLSIVLRGSTVYSTTTSAADGTYSFSRVPVSPNIDNYLSITLPADARANDPVIGAPGTLPEFTSPTEIRFPGCYSDECLFAPVGFRVRLWQPPAQLLSASPERVWPPVQVRGGASPRNIDAPVITVQIDEYHDQLRYYLVRQGCPNDPTTTCTEGTDYFEATLLRYAIPPDPTNPPFVELEVPEIPALRYGNYRVVAHDTWARSGNNPVTVGSWRYAPEIVFVGAPPYPYLHSFHFFNQSGGGSPEEFTAVYGLNMFTDPVHCAPWPHYAAWYPIYVALANRDGSCVGMSVTSRMMAGGELPLSRWDPDALYANGHRTGPFLRLNPDPDPTVTPFFGLSAPRPESWSFDFPCRFAPDNLWAEICKNHGAQLSNEMLRSLVPQLFGSGSFPDRRWSEDGEPRAVLTRISSNPSDFVICMTPRFGSGHCVTPYATQPGFRFDRPGAGETFPVADPDFTLIHVYDNNAPDAVRYIEIDRVNDQFLFPYIVDDAGTRIYSGRAISAHPLSIWRGGRSMPDLRLTTYLHLLIFGSADVLHTDTAGNSWGWENDGSTRDEIDGTKAVSMFTGIEGNSRNTQLFLPKTVRLSTSAINIREDGMFGLYAAHEGLMLRLQVPGAGAGEGDLLDIRQESDGALRGFSYAPSKTRKGSDVLIGFIPDDTSSVTYTLGGLTLKAGGAYDVSANRSDRSVKISNNAANTLNFTVTVNLADTAATAWGSVDHEEFELQPGTSLTASLPNWPAFDRLEVGYDSTGDGVIDSVEHRTQGTPSLRVRWEDNQGEIVAVVSYPNAFAGWTLEGAESLLSPWIPITHGEFGMSESGNIEIRIPAVRQMHFRLRLPE